SRPRLGTERAGGLGESLARRTVRVTLGRRDEQSAGEQVVARRDADRELARGARIELGWSPAALAASFAESLVRDAEELVLGQFVQVVGGQGTADVGGCGGLVAPDGSVLARDVLVETATDGIVEVRQGRQVVLEAAARVHGPSLTTIIFDKQHRRSLWFHQERLILEVGSVVSRSSTATLPVFPERTGLVRSSLLIAGLPERDK